MENFFHMGGYAVWVWPGYGLAAVGADRRAGRGRCARLRAREREFERLKRDRRERP